MSVPWYLMAKGKGGGGYKTASGPIVSVNDALAAPLRSLLVNIDPVQDLHGYDSPWPSGGGKNKIYFVSYSTDDYFKFSPILEPVIDVTNQTITMNCAASGQTVLLYKHNFPAGQYTIKFTVTAYNKRSIVRCFDSSNNVLTDSDVSVTGGSWNSFYQAFYVNTGDGTFTVPDEVDHFWVGVGVSNDVRDKTVTISKIMLELGSTATPYEPYSNICPISGFTGLNVHVADGENPHVVDNVYPVSWQSEAGTVYGGTLDVTTGVLTVRPYYGSYNGEPLVGPWISSMDAYAPGATPTTGAQVVDLGGTPIEIPLTATQISLLAGQNALWADSGDVTVEYLSSGGTDPDLMKLAVAFMGRNSKLVASW